jgi:hypothetical protein
MERAAMAALSPSLSLSSVRVAATWRLLAPLAALHALMLAYDVANPDRFLRADRAGGRMQVVEGFPEALRAGEATTYLASHGIAGDWLPHALMYALGGPLLIVLVQVALALASVLWVREIGSRLGLASRHATAAAVLYALLPHTLVFPHQLSTEALFVPLVIAAFRFALPVAGPAGGLALGLATLVRPITVLWPVVQAVLQPGPLRRRAAFLALALAPLLLWMAFILSATGEFSMGRSGHDLGGNLYYRMQRMAAPLPPAERPETKPAGQTKATVGEYLSYSLAHPKAAAAHHARDVVTLTVKSGIERVTLDYLDLFPEMRGSLQKADGGWRASVEKQGALQTALALFKAQPGPS